MKRMIKVLMIIVLTISAIIFHVIFMLNAREGLYIGSEWVVYAIIIFLALNKVCEFYEKSEDKA